MVIFVIANFEAEQSNIRHTFKKFIASHADARFDRKNIDFVLVFDGKVLNLWRGNVSDMA